MTNSTPDYWSVDGVSLETLAWGIDKWGGPLQAPPELRGGGRTVPYRPGELWSPQVPKARVLPFAMWVSQATEAGTYAATEASREAQLLANWQMLRALLWVAPSRQLTVVKRWDSGTASATALGSFAGGLEPVNMGLTALQFTANVLLSDPWFYSAPQTLLDDAAVGTHNVAGDILGDAPSPRYVWTVTGPLNNPSLTVKAGAVTLSTVALAGAVPDGDTWTVDMPSGRVTTDTALTAAHVSAHQVDWVTLDPAATSIVVGGTGAGTVTLTHEPAWL